MSPISPPVSRPFFVFEAIRDRVVDPKPLLQPVGEEGEAAGD